MNPTDQKKAKPRGFAAMPHTEVVRLAQMGGAAAHAMGRAHVFTSEEAKIAGSKGGKAMHAKRRAEQSKSR